MLPSPTRRVPIVGCCNWWQLIWFALLFLLAYAWYIHFTAGRVIILNVNMNHQGSPWISLLSDGHSNSGN
jgi:hypothetical protein